MKTILVVEDEFDLLRAIASVLEGEGYGVLTAGDGEQALKVLKERTPDLLILDVMLPYRSGVEVLKQLRARVGDGPPAILMSVVRPQGTREEAGWQTFLQKPFTLERLLSAVEGHVGKGERPPEH